MHATHSHSHRATLGRQIPSQSYLQPAQREPPVHIPLLFQAPDGLHQPARQRSGLRPAKRERHHWRRRRRPRQGRRCCRLPSVGCGSCRSPSCAFFGGCLVGCALPLLGPPPRLALGGTGRWGPRADTVQRLRKTDEAVLDASVAWVVGGWRALRSFVVAPLAPCINAPKLSDLSRHPPKVALTPGQAAPTCCRDSLHRLSNKFD